LSHPFFRDCNSNKKEYAVNNQGNETGKKDNEFSLLSVSSYEKTRKNRDIKTALDKGTLQKDSLWYKINEKLTNGGYRDLKTLQFPDSFEDISENDPRQYIALIYADGNDMGHTVQHEIRGLEELGEFSTRIDEAIYTAASTAIIRHLHPEGLKRQKKLPFDILLIGGDDLVMVVPAISALTVSLTIGQTFYETTGKSLCIGVTYAHDKYPIHSLLHITEDLLKSAKTERAVRLLKNEKDEAKKGMINFLVIQQSGSLTWEDYKRDNLDYKEMTDNGEHSFERTCRPYTFKDVSILMGLSKDFKEKKFPLNKLHMLREAAFKSFYQSRITSRFVFTRSNITQQELLYTLFQLPGIFAGNEKLHKGTSLFYRVNNGTDPCYKTALLDLIDIYSFLNSRDDEAEK
jgi:CRISPR-associated protein Cmr2